MRRACTEHELLEQWTVAPEERLLVLGKSGTHSLGVTLQIIRRKSLHAIWRTRQAGAGVA
jgi:hypothetical protein